MPPPGELGGGPFDNARVAEAGLSQVGQYIGVQCKEAANRWVRAAGGNLGGGYYSDYQRFGGTLVARDAASKGDVIQLNRPGALDTYFWPMHTAVVVGHTPGSNTFDVVDSNFKGDDVVRRHAWDPYAQAAQGGLVVHIWRMGTLTSEPPRSPEPQPGLTQFWLRNSNTSGAGDILALVGDPGDRPITGDWNGDGVDTIGVYRPSNNTFYERNTNDSGPGVPSTMGNAGDVPLTGDWDGDGVDTIGVYRPSNNTFYLRNSNTSGAGQVVATMGNFGDVPITGDWNGDGVDTIGVYRPSNNTFYERNTNDSGPGLPATMGNSGDIPITGDWNGDGVDTIGVYRPSNHTFYERNTNDSGPGLPATMGNSGDVPITGDWNGDGMDTIGVYR